MENPESPVDSKAENNSPPVPRPRSVTTLALGVLIITIINLLRLVLSITNWDFLGSWPGVSPFYMASSGFVWTIAGSFLFWGLWTAKKWAPRLAQAVALTYALYYWLDHVFLMDHPNSGAVGVQRALLPVNWQFAAGLTAICLLFVAWMVSRPNVHKFFGLDGSSENDARAS